MKRALSRKNLWQTMPVSAKRIIGLGLAAVPVPYLLGKRFRQQLRFVRDADHWPADRSREYQLRQLRRICSLAYDGSVFYRKLFDRAGFRPGDLKTPEDLASLPTIDKHTVREHLDEMCVVNPDSSRIDCVATGGSTGEPLRFYIGSERSAIEYAYLVASWGRVGYQLRFPMAVLRGRVVPINRRGLHHEYDPVLRHHYYSNFHMTDENMRAYLEHIATIGECFLHAYPSSATALARFILRTGHSPPGNIRGIIAESENIYPDQRGVIEEVFGVRFFSCYGHCEKLVLAAECEQTSQYHIWPTYGCFELLDKRGHRVTTPGKRGEIIGTGFINKVIPFIRYRTGDYATYLGDRCGACGREHPVVDKLEGRWPQGNLITADGGTVSMTALNVHDDTFENVRDYQYRQSESGEAVLCVVPVRPLTERDRTRILGRLNKRLQGQVHLTLEVCRELLKTQQGKQPRVVWEGPQQAKDG